MPMSSLVLSMNVLLISALVLSLAMGLNFSVPIAATEIPPIRADLSRWLTKPPYLYIIINGIIIAIAAASRFSRQSQSEPPAVQLIEDLISVGTPQPQPSSFESLAAAEGVSSECEGPSTSVSTAASTINISQATTDLKTKAEINPSFGTTSGSHSNFPANNLHNSLSESTTKSVPLFSSVSTPSSRGFSPYNASGFGSSGTSPGFASLFNTSGASWSSIFSMPPGTTKSKPLLDIIKSGTSFGSTPNNQGFSPYNASGFSSSGTSPGFASILNTASASSSSIFTMPPGFTLGPSVSSQSSSPLQASGHLEFHAGSNFKSGRGRKILKINRAKKVR